MKPSNKTFTIVEAVTTKKGGGFDVDKVVYLADLGHKKTRQLERFDKNADETYKWKESIDVENCKAVTWTKRGSTLQMWKELEDAVRMKYKKGKEVEMLDITMDSTPTSSPLPVPAGLSKAAKGK